MLKTPEEIGHKRRLGYVENIISLILALGGGGGGGGVRLVAFSINSHDQTE